MSELMIFNQKITVESVFLFDAKKIMPTLKLSFIKNCISLLLKSIYQMTHLPPELRGYIAQFEINIKKYITLNDDAGFYAWLGHAIADLHSREQLYATWYKNTATQLQCRPSYLLEKLRQRIFSTLNEVHAEIEQSISQAIVTLKEQVHQEAAQAEKSKIIQEVEAAITQYKQSCWLPMGVNRGVQQAGLLFQLHESLDGRSAIRVLQAHILDIENNHHNNSFFAQWTLFQRKSRLVLYLQKAYIRILSAIKIPSDIVQPKVMMEVLHVIDAYFNSDIFYHNRARRHLLYVFLKQLQADELIMHPIERSHQLRMTFDRYIALIDEDFYKTHFFAQFYKTKRSRIAVQLEALKNSLISKNILPRFNLQSDIKILVINRLDQIMQQISDVSMRRETNTLMAVIREAKTPHGIEAILEGHIRSAFKAAEERDLLTSMSQAFMGKKDPYFIVALQLESALLDWQAQGLLPAASGYHTFLSTLAQQRDRNENDLQQLEQQYGIRIPRQIDTIRETNRKTVLQANTLLQKMIK